MEKIKMSANSVLLFKQLGALEDAKIIVMKPVGLFNKRYDAQAVIDVTNACETKRYELWQEVYRIHPEAKSGDWNYTLEHDEAFIQKMND